jgi:outer membrane protein assembly factor BamB
VLAPLALVNWYPSSEHAKLVAYDADTGDVLWETTTPARHLFAVTGKAGKLTLVGMVDDGQCGGYRFITLRIDPASGQIVRRKHGGDAHAVYVKGGPYEGPADEVSGLRWDTAAGRIVSDQGWSVKADPDRGNVPALVTPDAVFVGVQGYRYLSCSN